MGAPKTLRDAARDLTLMSDDGTEYEHNDGCQGEPECPACWVEGIRQLFIDFPEEGARIDLPSTVLRKTVSYFLDQREEYVRVLRQCVDADADYHRWQGHAEARRQLRDRLEKAGVDLTAEPRDEATVKAEAIREAAQAQRQLAADARTNNGQAEHEDFADWLDDRAFAIDPAVVEGAHP